MGTISITYQGSPGGAPTTLSASATISDADAATMFAWGLQNIGGGISGPAPTTSQGVFSALAAGWFNQVTTSVMRWQQQQAIAAANIKPITITPST